MHYHQGTYELLIARARIIKFNSVGQQRGASCLCKDKNGHTEIFDGCNVELPDNQGCCPERLAILKAISAQYPKVVALASEGMPCVSCLGLLARFAESDLTILYVEGLGSFSIDKIRPQVHNG